MLFASLKSKICILQSKMKKAMSFAPMAFSIVDEQVVSDHQRQWAGRKGTTGPEGAEAPG
jgi:hypothetical protein